MYREKILEFINIWKEKFGFMRTVEEQISVDAEENPLPWYTYPAIEYLSQFDFSDKRIFEYGTAYSSLFWAKRAKQVVSVEDDLKWYKKWSCEFNLSNIDLRFREGENYPNAVFEDGQKYDVIVIDGRQRAECAAAAVQALAEEGLIIFDDSDRSETCIEYRTVTETLKNAGLLQVDFYGFCPMNVYPKATSIFLTRNFNFSTIKPVQPTRGIGSIWNLPRKERKAKARKKII